MHWPGNCSGKWVGGGEGRESKHYWPKSLRFYADILKKMMKPAQFDAWTETPTEIQNTQEGTDLTVPPCTAFIWDTHLAQRVSRVKDKTLAKNMYS